MKRLIKALYMLVLLIIAFGAISANVAEARSGCCSHHGGVCGCACCDGSPLSAKCAPYYPECTGGGAKAAKETRVGLGKAAAPLEDFTGKVVGILDGDTIEVMHSGKAERIRLDGIDCPEKTQAFGSKAKQYTSSLVFGREVTVKAKERDKYGRTVGAVVLADGRILNEELVKAGFAWWYQKYAPNDTTLQKLESDAREGKLGLWADPNPSPPWEYRHKK